MVLSNALDTVTNIVYSSYKFCFFAFFKDL